MVVFKLEDGGEIRSTDSGNLYPPDSERLQKLLSYQVGVFGHTIDPLTSNPHDLANGLDQLGIPYTSNLPSLKISNEVIV